MCDEDWSTVLESTHEAVCTYARAEFEALTRKVIHRLRGAKASGVFGDDYGYETLWDEYCHEVQEGPHNDLLQWAWHATITAFLDDLIERVPRHVSVLLSIFAARELEERDEAGIVGSVWPEGMRDVLWSELAEQAGCRSLSRFTPA